MSAVASRSLRSMRRRSCTAGFSLLELTLAVIVVCVLGAFALDRFLYYQERAEKAAMESTLALVKMGLQIHLAELIMANRQNLAATLERENPMKWLEPPPTGYAGEYAQPLKSGHWYYASKEHELIYIPASNYYLDSGRIEPNELRFRVVIQSVTSPVTGRPMPVGVSLAPSKNFKWF